MNTKSSAVVLLTVLLMNFSAHAGDVAGLTTYSSGDTLSAEALNNDNAQITSAVNGNALDIGTNATNIQANSVSAGSNAAAISVNTNNIGTNASAIGVNTNNIGTNASAIGVNTNNISTNASAISSNTNKINTNITSIDTNTSAIATKQNRVAGTCASGQSIREINADGTVVCEVDTDTDTTYTAGKGLKLTDTTFSIATGSVSVSAPAFHNGYDTGCSLYTNGQYTYFYSGIAGCVAYTSIQFPDGVTPVAMRCAVQDADATGGKFLQIDLVRVSLSNGTKGTVFTASSSTTSSSVQVISDTTASLGSINNADYGYHLSAYFGGSPSITLLLYGCTVSYQ